MSYDRADYPKITKASLLDEANHVYASMTPTPPPVPTSLSYMQADFNVDITKMHDYRVVAYNSVGQPIGTSNVQSYGPPPPPASVHGTARVDTTHGYLDVIDLTWVRPNLVPTLAQGAEPCWTTFALHDSTGTVVANAKAKDSIVAFPVTFGVPALSENYIIDPVIIHPGKYSITAQSVPCYGFDANIPITLAAPVSTDVTVGPDPGKLTLAKPKPNAVIKGHPYTMTGRLLARSTDVTTPPTTVTIYTRTSTTGPWKAVTTLTTAAQGQFSYTMTPTATTTYVRAKSTTTATLMTATRKITLVAV